MKFPKLNSQHKKYFVGVLASIGVLVLVILSASLQNLELKPGQIFFAEEDTQPDFISEIKNFVDSVGAMTFGEALILTAGFLILFVLILVMLSPEGRKRVIMTILRVGLTAWAIFYVLNKFRPEGIFEIDPSAAQLEQGSQVIATPPLYTPPVIPAWVNYVASLLIVLFFAGVGSWLYRFFLPPKHQFQNLAHAARTAIKDLSAGRDWDDTVIRCYARMSEALDQERGIRRHEAMTPQEFAYRLERVGLPSEPVRRLTDLFEKARYGGRKSSREDVNEAVSCLTAILHAVGAQP